MFNFLKKKEKKANEDVGILYAPVNGKLISISEVEDPVFSQKMMGDGYAVLPTSEEIYAPVSGKVVSVFPTKHAIGFVTSDGVEVLLHMGLDTVELNGAPFSLNVKEGDVVTAATVVAHVDLEALKKAEKNNAMVVVLTNMDQVASFNMKDSQEVQSCVQVGNFKKK